MKSKIISAVMALLMMAGVASGIDAQRKVAYQGGPGIVMSGSQNYSKLPKAAKSFIEKHYKDQKVVKCEQYFAKNKYEVELANGVDIDFNNAGKVIEIDAPGNRRLAQSVVKDVLHSNAYRRLVKDGYADDVESIELDKRGRLVEIELSIPEPDTYVFDINGNFVALSD